MSVINPNSYRVGISIPDGPTMGWNEGGETLVSAKTAEAAIEMARAWAEAGDYGDSEAPVRVRLTAVNCADTTDRASEVVRLGE